MDSQSKQSESDQHVASLQKALQNKTVESEKESQFHKR